MPSNVVALWAVNDHDRIDLQAFSAWAEERFAARLPAVGTGDFKSLQTALVEQLSLATQLYAKRNTALEDALSVLRIEHEETRQVLYRMQELLWNVHNNPVHLTFASKLGTRHLSFNPPAAAQSVKIEQRLPISGRGLAGFDVHVAEASKGPGYLRCVLFNAADQSSIGSWVIEYDDISRGWLNFSLPVILDINPRYMTISIECVGGRKPPTLTLAASRVVGLPSVSLQGTQLADQTLAIRVWVGFPGLRNEAVGSHIQGIASDRRFAYTLPASAFAEVRKAVSHKSDFEYISRQSDGSILVHPLWNKIASALVPAVVPKGATGLETTVSIEGNCPSPIEFAFSVAPSSTKPVSGGRDPDWQRIGQFSGWHLVRENFVKQTFALDFAEPLQGGHDLYLLTRVPNGGSVDYGQAMFHRFVVSTEGQIAAYAPDAGTQTAMRTGGLKDETKAKRSASVIIHNLDAEILRELRPTRTFPIGFQHVQLVDGSKALVHPVRGETSIAVLPDCLRPSSAFVRATVAVGGDRFTSPVQFALGVGTTDDAQDPSEIRLSAWVTITEPGETSEVAFDIGHTPVDERVNLYLLTRVPNGRSVDHASAYFENIQVATAQPG
jgi:hypothetical protein